MSDRMPVRNNEHPSIESRTRVEEVIQNAEWMSDEEIRSSLMESMGSNCDVIDARETLFLSGRRELAGKLSLFHAESDNLPYYETKWNLQEARYANDVDSAEYLGYARNSIVDASLSKRSEDPALHGYQMRPEHAEECVIEATMLMAVHKGTEAAKAFYNEHSPNSSENSEEQIGLFIDSLELLVQSRAHFRLPFVQRLKRSQKEKGITSNLGNLHMIESMNRSRLYPDNDQYGADIMNLTAVMGVGAIENYYREPKPGDSIFRHETELVPSFTDLQAKDLHLLEGRAVGDYATALINYYKNPYGCYIQPKRIPRTSLADVARFAATNENSILLRQVAVLLREPDTEETVMNPPTDFVRNSGYDVDARKVMADYYQEIQYEILAELDLAKFALQSLTVNPATSAFVAELDNGTKASIDTLLMQSDNALRRSESIGDVEPFTLINEAASFTDLFVSDLLHSASKNKILKARKNLMAMVSHSL